jgi:two-component system sensor histidine kinase PilS (NtrC family)
MTGLPKTLQEDLYDRLKWLMFVRVLFTTLLLGSTIVLQLNRNPSLLARPLIALYGLIAAIFFLSFIYFVMLPRIKNQTLFVYAQIGIDTIVVSMIIFLTGSFSSIFSFLYLVVIIYASMFLFTTGGIIIATLCSIQYAFLLNFEYYGLITPFGMGGSLVATHYPMSQVLFKIMITAIACFAVAFLSSLLVERERKTKRELIAMEMHVERVEKMAAIGEMGAGLAHEIKNPLASLTGSIQLLREDFQYNPYHDKLMQIILREADRLSVLVNDFLMFARPPVGRAEEIELEKAISETVGLFEKGNTGNGRLTINEEVTPGLWIEMDPSHFRQVLWNLLLNAAEAIEDKGVIEIRVFLLKQDQVCITIKDNGKGISPEITKSIFDPFFTTKSNGTGLGLSIVHRIIESYKSQLDVESVVNEGTTFSLKLNCVKQTT